MKRFLTILALSFPILIGSGFLNALPVSAQVNTGLNEVGQTVKLSSADPRIIASNIINVALGLVGIILVGIIVYAGFLYMTSGGEAEKVATAKKWIISAIIGLVIILSAWAIARFVIDRLLQATGGGGTTTTGQGGGGLGGGFGGGGISNVFQVKSISPQGSVPIRNVQVKMMFTRPVDENSASAIVMTKDGGTTVGGTIAVSGSLVAFTPSDACPAPNDSLKCFDANADYTVHIGAALRSSTGQTIVCGGFAPPCTATFHTGDAIDVQAPAVSVTNPLDGQAVPADSLVPLQAHATDDSGISYVEFLDNGTLVDQDGPQASSSPTTFDASVQWDTAGASLQSVHQLAAKAFDIDTHETQSAAVSVVVRSPSCFNGVKDGDEIAIDCGGTPNTPGFCGACAGGSCSSNAQCSSGVCTNGSCVDQPTITSVGPMDGRPGTFVTIKGSNFGTSGSVVFLGGAGDADDAAASAPQSCSQSGFTTWTPTQIVIAVPQGAVIGPIKVENAGSQLSDTTNDSRGPHIPDFVVNDTAYPGLCGLQPSSGFVGDQFKAVGQGFGANPSSLSFGSSVITSFSAWVDDQITANVPVVGVGKHAVSVAVGNNISNQVDYTVQNKSTAGPPTVLNVDPAAGPKSEYVTISGTNFGFSVGTVRFKNKISGQEAIGDTAFPAGCASGFWNETNVVVKVPQQLLGGGALPIGDYTVRIVRSDNVASNEKDFTVNSETPKPGICAISPNVGPIGTTVTVTGDRFGGNTQSVTFYSAKAAIATSWTNTEIKTTVPTGAVTGPLKISVQGIASNGVNFQVRNCNEQPGICSQSEQCCANGSCVPSGQSCGAVSLQAMYAWQSSTGLIPVAPRVVEECAPGQVPQPIPSPAPWGSRAGGDQVCVTATIDARFTTHLDPTTVTKSNIHVKKCTSGSSDPCATTTDVPIASGFPVLQPASADQDAMFIQPQADLDPSTTYLVQITTGIKGAGPSGDNMEERPDCGSGIAYCFRFKTRVSTAACAVGGVSVAPHPYTLNDAGATVPYLASPLSSEDKCVVLKCDAFDWDWEHGDQNADGRAIFQTPLAINQATGKTSCRQMGVAVTETGDVPVNMNAIAKPDLVKGTASLFVKFIPPRVEAFAPNCQQSCTNALVWARFSTALDPASLSGNIEIRQCANENCVLSELSAPLKIPAGSISLTTIPKSTETALRFLSIEPVKPGVVPGTKDLLLQPGSYYRVLLRAGTSQGIHGLNGVPMTGLNDPDGFAWTFRTKIGDAAFCAPETVDVSPIEKYETVVGARQTFMATPYGHTDECSAAGQALVQTSSVDWKTSDAQIADFVGSGSVDTGGTLPAQCGPTCRAMGSQAEFGKVAVCGNGMIETTDGRYCTNGQTPTGDACTVLPSGANAGEECDPGVASNVGLCDATTCLWKPIAQQPNGTCGNGTIEQGEACDFGRFCMGAPATSTTPDMTLCIQNADKATCEANGGTCAPRQYRGCSAFCRHTGSLSANSTCGNSDVADGEDCDDGNINGQDGCSSQCLHTGSTSNVASVCGNAILEPGETCEKNNANDPTFPAGCLAKTCLHTGAGQCDNDPNTPDTNCCGNASVDSGEDCDDGNKTSGDGCNASCLLEGSSLSYPTPSFCSDGVLETGEQCEVSLPSSDPTLLNAAKNAAPVAPKGTPQGDGVVDNLQLAEIIGNGTPDQNDLMSSKLSAGVEGKTGEATYGLRCGFTDEASCPAGFGLTDQGCCQARPELTASYPSGVAVCRNTEISATFNVDMNVGSVASNAQVAKEELSGNCPTGTTQVTDDFSPVPTGLFAWLHQTWRRVVAWWKADPALAAVWCRGSVTGSWVPRSPKDIKEFVFRFDSVLAPDTRYRVKFAGDNSTSTNPLGDNATISLKQGIKTVKGVVSPYDVSADSGPLTFSFQTGPDICSVNVVNVQDTFEDHPLLFIKGGEQHDFVAQALAIQNGVSLPINPVAEYSWKWLPWTTSDGGVVNVVSPLPDQTSATIEAKNKNGNAFVVAWVQITQDTIHAPSTTNAVIQGTAPVTVSLCENPWPTLETAPFRDKKPTGNDSSLVGSIFENGPYFNFATSYCRDAGAFGSDDDIPALSINFVPQTSTDAIQGILRQYLFSYGPDHPELKKDGIGIRIAANPLHLSPEDWYAWRGFGGKLQSTTIDGYRALKDGTTTYIAAANTENPGKKIYSNIYLISHNPDASPATIGIYDQMVQNLVFNINLTDGVANVCEMGNDPGLEPSEPFFPAGNTPVVCSTDVECLKYADNLHCGSYKEKLARDTVRVADFQLMSREIEQAHQRLGTYPKLAGGTFLPGVTNSIWPSWDAELKSSVGQDLPKDPINQFITCGRCSQSQSVCSQHADCPGGQTCTGVTYKDGSFETSTSTEVSTCWDPQTRRFFCPRVGASPSHVYQYRSINGGVRYELGSEFEVPMPASKNAEWWEPSLPTEVKRCTNKDVSGFLCSTDADCRPCGNPQDMNACPLAQYPVTNGACQSVGGRYVYQSICTNTAYGQSGTCGDGVIGQACSGGSNEGNACTQNSDCPGGSCTASETCELGQTKLADCKTADNKDGLKVQVCSECKQFVDDPNVSACKTGIQCGNGRIDKVCSGGNRSGLACAMDTECTGGGACVSSGETCDDGVLNGTYGHCNLTCNGYAAYCGDGQLSPGEVCDNGNQNGQYCGVGCNVSQTCSLDCKNKAPYCGEGIITSPEQCDGQGQTTDLAICIAGTNTGQPCKNDSDCGQGGTCAAGNDPLSSCQGVSKTRCATSMKQCVPANLNSCANYDPSAHIVCQGDADCSGQPGGNTSCRALQDFCFDCTSNQQCSYQGISGTCNSLPTAHVRSCNVGGQDQCTYTAWSSCKITGFCGDGKIDAPGEECDNGSGNGDTKSCTASCKKNVCGDGKPFVGVEECDAGSQNGTITCSADYNSSCSSCSTQCKFLASAGGYCGDTVKNGPEQCDGTAAISASSPQFATCPDPANGKINTVCPYVNAECLQSPCQKTTEVGVTCQSLGYDFATNGARPMLKANDPALDVPDSQSSCTEYHSMKKYEIAAYEACLGMKCNPKICVIPGVVPGTCQQLAAGIQYKGPLPSVNDFWKCVQEKGPALGVGITTNQSPIMVQCSASCSYSGCGRCSDENGSGVLSAQLVDAVYNQVVAFARVSLFYKGVLIAQTASDGDGKFSFTSVNDRAECSQYKIIVDKYDDNPCTGNASGRPSCGAPAAPDWTYQNSVNEGDRGGYWPYTSPIFTPGSFKTTVSPQSGTSTDARIYIFPRPAAGEAYYSVLWDTPWTNIAGGLGIAGLTSNHLILPKAFAYTAPNGYDLQSEGYPGGFTPSSCSYDSRPSVGQDFTETRQCVRDVTSRVDVKGSPDLIKPPYAELICLHSPGEKVGGGADSPWEGCPVEGRSKCLAANNGDASKCNRAPNEASCQFVNVGDPCTHTGNASTDTCVHGSGELTCDASGHYVATCNKEWWDTCDFYKNGPLTTYFRYSAYAGSLEPVRLFWGWQAKSVNTVLNPNGSLLSSFLTGKKYHAVISTDTQLIELNGKDASSSCGKDCKFWHIADLNSTDGLITAQNVLRKQRVGDPQFTEGVAIYETDFQGWALWSDQDNDGNDDIQYCMDNSNVLYQVCPANAVCPAGAGTCKHPTFQQWSQANY